MQHAIHIQEALLEALTSSGTSIPVDDDRFLLWAERYEAAWRSKGWKVEFRSNHLTLAPSE